MARKLVIFDKEIEQKIFYITSQSRRLEKRNQDSDKKDEIQEAQNIIYEMRYTYLCDNYLRDYFVQGDDNWYYLRADYCESSIITKMAIEDTSSSLILRVLEISL